jgi:hypothetical protein
MTDDDDIQEYARPCPNCEYHRKRAQRWREEAYKLSGHPLPEREWRDLTGAEVKTIRDDAKSMDDAIYMAETKLKEKNR